MQIAYLIITIIITSPRTSINMKSIVGIISITFVTLSCASEKGIYFDWENNSDSTIEYLIPYRDSRFRAYTVSMADIGSLDTAIIRYSQLFSRLSVNSYSCKSMDSGFTSFKQITNPYDTLRIFVYDYSYEHDPDARKKLEKMYKNDEYFYRYDLSIADLESL